MSVTIALADVCGRKLIINIFLLSSFSPNIFKLFYLQQIYFKIDTVVNVQE